MELVGTHTQKRGCERLLHSIGMDTRRSKSKREAKDNLEKDGGERKKQGRVEELGSSKRGGTEQGVLVGKRDGLIRLAQREMMMMMMAEWCNDVNNVCDTKHCILCNAEQ